MTPRDFFKNHFLKLLIALIAIQLVIISIVQNYNHRPVAVRDLISMSEGRSAKITPLANDTDKDEKDVLSIVHISSPKNGTNKQNGKLLTYIPNTSFTGVDSFPYIITDGRKKSKEGYIVVNVNKNLPPVANRDSVIAYSGDGLFINVLRNDSDAEGDSLFIKEFSQPVHGKLNICGNNLLYKSGMAQLQTDSFTYKSSDGKGISNTATVVVELKSKNDPCYPWFSADIGDVAIKGSFICENKIFIIKASGSDIWNRFDGFRYAYQYVNGDCEMSTKVESIEALHEWAKAGIMIRESLTGGSKMALVFVSPKNGVVTHQRWKDNDQAEFGISLNDKKAPHWVKITRKGNTLTFYSSEDGLKWQEMSSIDFTMKKEVYIGFAVSSHNNSEVSKAVFSNSTLKAKPVKTGDIN